MKDYDELTANAEPERYEFDEAPRYHFELNRRSFMRVVGAGLLVSANVNVQAQGATRSPSSRSIQARLHFGENGIVSVFTSKVEVGQGSRTQLTQAVAEELRISMERVRMIMADTDIVPNDGGTFGSLTTPQTVPTVRSAAATAREAFLDAAAKQMKTKRASLSLVDGAVVHARSGRRLEYSELALQKEIVESFKQKVSRSTELTPSEDWTVLGQPTPKPTERKIVTGEHRYPSDIVRPQMLYGQVLRPPSYGAILKEVDLSATKGIEGVETMRDGQFVGCAAPTSFGARQAMEAIAQTARWEERSDHASSMTLTQHLRKHAHRGEPGQRRPMLRATGSTEQAFHSAKSSFEATYEIPYIQHVPMEPRAAVAEWKNGRLHVWTGTQRPAGVRGELARAFSISGSKVRVVVPDTGGGFGGKHTGDAAIEAARLAKAVGRPVSVRWTREEEFTWAYFRPAGVIDIKAGLDEDGRITAWDFTNINSGASALESPYAIANKREIFLFCDSPLREGSYRSLAATANTFAREAFMDELAEAAGADSLAFRLAHLEDERLRGVLNAAARTFGWKEKAKGFGIACGTDKGGYTAACVQVNTDAQGGFRIARIVQAFDCGKIQNPMNLRAQVEGCIIMGLGGALHEAIHFDAGRIRNATLKKYDVPRFNDVPPIEVVLVDRPDLPSAGAGETPIIAIAPALANALASAKSTRTRRLPMLS